MCPKHRDLFPVISSQPAISACSDSPRNSRNAIRSHVLNAGRPNTPAFDLSHRPPSTSFLIILLALFSALLKTPACGRPKASSLYFKKVLTCRCRAIKINPQIISETLCSAFAAKHNKTYFDETHLRASLFH